MNALSRVCLLFAVMLFILPQDQLLAQNAGGVLINTEGMLTPNTQQVNNALAMKRRQAFLKDSLGSDVQKESAVRKVSLIRLSKECAKYIDEKKEFTPEMKFLAGLTSIDYVFVDVEHKDIVIAGPAGPFAPDANNMMCNTVSKRPVLRLEDLIVAMRGAVDKLDYVGCSIDPVKDNLAALQREMQNNTPIPMNMVPRRFAQLANVLGSHDVSVMGVKPDTNIARVFVEADLRMKRIAIGIDPSFVAKLPSHLASLNNPGNTMQRWWFVPSYDAVYVSEERDAFELAGQRLQLMSQDEVANMSGQRFAASKQKLSTQKWAKMFTDNFPELCTKWTPFAELQNVMDLILVTSLIEREKLAEKFSWNREIFLDNNKIPCGGYPVPKHTHAVFNTKKNFGLISGGVTIYPEGLLESISEEDGTKRRLHGLKNQHLNNETPSFWWD